MLYLLFSYSNDAFTPPPHSFRLRFVGELIWMMLFSFRSTRLKSSHCSHFLLFFRFCSDQIRAVELSYLLPFRVSDCAYAVSCYSICLDRFSPYEGFGSQRMMRISLLLFLCFRGTFSSSPRSACNLLAVLLILLRTVTLYHFLSNVSFRNQCSFFCLSMYISSFYATGPSTNISATQIFWPYSSYLTSKFPLLRCLCYSSLACASYSAFEDASIISNPCIALLFFGTDFTEHFCGECLEHLSLVLCIYPVDSVSGTPLALLHRYLFRFYHSLVYSRSL